MASTSSRRSSNGSEFFLSPSSRRLSSSGELPRSTGSGLRKTISTDRRLSSSGEITLPSSGRRSSYSGGASPGTPNSGRRLSFSGEPSPGGGIPKGPSTKVAKRPTSVEESSDPAFQTGAGRQYSWSAQRIHELQEDSDRKNERIKELNNHFKLFKAQIEELTAERNTATAELEAAKERVSSWRVKYTDTSASLNESQDTNRKLEEDKRNLELQVAQLKESLRKEEDLKRDVESQRMELINWKQQALKTMEVQENTISDLNHKLDVATADVEALEIELGQKNAQVAKLDQDLSVRNHTIRNLQGDVAARDKKIDALTYDFDNLDKDHKISLAFLKAREEEISMLTQQVSKLTSELNSRDRHIQQLSSAHDRLQSDNAQLSSMLEQRESQIKSLSTTMEEYEQQAGWLLKMNKRVSENRQQQAVRR